MGMEDSIFSYCVGGLALISTIFSVLFYCRLYLPATQLRLLDEVLVETKEIHRKASDEGLLLPDVSRHAKERLKKYEDESDVLREITYRARSTIDTLRALFRGHTSRIMRLAGKIEILRSFLMTVSQREKARRVEEHPQRPTAPPAGDPLHADGITQSATPRIDSVHCSSAYQLSSLPPELDTQDLPSLPTADDQLTASTCSLPPDEDRHTPARFSYPFLWKLSRMDGGLLSFVAKEEDQCLPSTDASTSSRASTLVDTPAQKSTWCPQSLFGSVRIPAPSCQADHIQMFESNQDDTFLHRYNASTTSPV